MKAPLTQLPSPTLLEPMLTLHQKLQKQPNKKAAWKIVEEYFDCYHVSDAHKELWTMLFASLSMDEDALTLKGKDRQDLVFFYQFTMLLLEAVQLLKKARKQ